MLVLLRRKRQRAAEERQTQEREAYERETQECHAQERDAKFQNLYGTIFLMNRPIFTCKLY